MSVTALSWARRVWRRLRGGTLSPSRLSASVALGLFIGALPVYGLHLPLCLALALPLRLDLVTTYAAAHVSTPPLGPVLLLVEVELGSWLLTGRPAPLTLAAARTVGVSGYVFPAVLGALVLGLTLAAIGFVVTNLLARRLRTQTPLTAAIQRTVARYRSAHPADRAYVAAKLESDPVLAGLASRPEAFGSVLDAGAGRGQLGLALLELGRIESLTGFDWDTRKVAVAHRAAGSDARFEPGTLAEYPWPAVDTILLIDVLHYLSPDVQDQVLASAFAALAPGGRLFVREVDATGWRSLPTIWAERLGTALGANRGATLAFRPARELCAVLERAGARCEVVAAAEGTPLTNVLVVASRQD